MVTPVRAIRGASQTTVQCPTRTPETSVMAFKGPVGSRPMLIPKSRRRARPTVSLHDSALRRRDPHRKAITPSVFLPSQALRGPPFLGVSLRIQRVGGGAEASCIAAHAHPWIPFDVFHPLRVVKLFCKHVEAPA